MYKQTATELNKLSPEKVKEWLNSFDTVLTDCDGKFMNEMLFLYQSSSSNTNNFPWNFNIHRCFMGDE